MTSKDVNEKFDYVALWGSIWTLILSRGMQYFYGFSRNLSDSNLFLLHGLIGACKGAMAILGEGDDLELMKQGQNILVLERIDDFWGVMLVKDFSLHNEMHLKRVLEEILTDTHEYGRRYERGTAINLIRVRVDMNKIIRKVFSRLEELQNVQEKE